MFTQSLVALVTPMDATGAIAYDTLHHLINFHINAGTAALVCVGTTGESATLSQEEHLAVIKQCVAFAAGRVPVIAGNGSNATADAIALTQQLEKIGIAGCLSVTPYYNKPTQEGLVRHFSAIAKSTHLPQILYNVPNRTGCDLLPETVARLAELPSIIGIKEASGDLSRVSRLRALTGDTFKLLSGDDATALDFMQLGGDGVISVTANVAAKSMALLAQQASAGHFSTARQLNQCLAPLHQALFTESNPIPVKWAMQRIGLIANDTVRLPLTPLSKTAWQQVEQALYTAQLLS